MIERYSSTRIADRLEIQDRITQFSRGVDRKDWDLALSVYHDGAIDRHGIYNGDAVGFIEAVKKRHETVLMSMHHVGNVLIDFLGQDVALVETYCLAWQSLSPENNDIRAALNAEGNTQEGPLEMLMINRYIDHFTRKNGAWKIEERVVAYESSMRVLPQAAGPDVSGTMELGRRDRSDPLWAMRRKLLGQG